MDKFYFIVGEFCAEGMGSNYTGYGAKFLIIHSDTYENAYKEAFSYAKSIFGKQEYKDMWYGMKSWNWKIIPYTLYGFNQEYKSIYNKLVYHHNNANLIFNGESLSKEEINEVYNDFLYKYPILIFKDNKIESFNGNIEDILDTKVKPDFSKPKIDIDNVNTDISEEDTEFFKVT